MKSTTLPFIAHLFLVLSCIIMFGYLAVLGQNILAPMFFAFLMAMLFLPFANFLEQRWRLSRPISTVAAVLVMVATIGGIVYFFSAQFSDFVNDFPVLEKQIVRTFHDLQNWVSKTFHVNFDKQMVYINQGLERLLSSTGLILGVTVSMFSQVLGFVVFSVLFFIFILNYRRLLYQFLQNIFPEKHIARVQEVMMETQTIIKQYISGLFIQILIVSVLTSVFLSILGVKYALLLGVLTGLLNVIPYIGIFFSCLMACLISFATGSPNTLIVLLGYIGIHAIDANVTLPLVVGSKVKINAFFSFVALLVGEHLWGISGMFLSIPFLAILKIIFEHVDDLKPWAKVMGEEVENPAAVHRYKMIKRLKWKVKPKENPQNQP